MVVEDRTAPEEKNTVTSTLNISDALDVSSPISQTTHFLEGNMLEIIRSEDIVDIMTSVLLKVEKLRI